jgi:hypothetical protein
MELCSSVLNTRGFFRFSLFPKYLHHLDYSPTKIHHAFLITKQFHGTKILNQLPSMKEVGYGTRKFISTKHHWILPQLVQPRSQFRQVPLKPNPNHLPMCPKVISFN